MITLFDRDSRPIIKRILSTYVRPYTGWVLQSIGWMMLAAAMSAVFAGLIQPVLDDVLIENRMDRIVPLGLAVMACFVIRGGATYMHTVLMNKTGQNIVSNIQSDVFTHLMHQDVGYHTHHASGTFVSHITSDTNVMRSAVAEGLTNLGKNTLTLVLLVGVMFWRDWQLTLAIFIIFPLTAAFIGKLGKRLRKLSTRTQESIANMTALLTQSFQGIRQVKAYNREAYESARLKTVFNGIRDLNIKNVRIGALNTPVNETLAGICVCGLIIYGGYQTANHALTPGELLSFIAAFLLSYEPMKRIAKVNNTLQIGFGAAARIFALLDTPLQILSGTQKPAITTPDVSFENVTFRYEPQKSPTLDNINFTAHSGTVTALVGASGGGKSTILNMVLRFYDPENGRITLGGHDLKTMDINHLRAHIALVSQDVTIFDDTAFANIAYGRQDATQDAVIAAAKAAHAHDFIMSLPHGYDTRLGENGVSLSGGQRQRISLARAFLKDAPILLLDEATSALDTESEHLVRESLRALEAGRTTLVIAHRLSTVQHADIIHVIDKGRIVESGTHAALLTQNGIYAGLYQRNQIAA